MTKTILLILLTVLLMTLYTNHQKKLAVTQAYWMGIKVAKNQLSNGMGDTLDIQH